MSLANGKTIILSQPNKSRQKYCGIWGKKMIFTYFGSQFHSSLSYLGAYRLLVTRKCYLGKNQRLLYYLLQETRHKTTYYICNCRVNGKNESPVQQYQPIKQNVLIGRGQVVSKAIYNLLLLLLLSLILLHYFFLSLKKSPARL